MKVTIQYFGQLRGITGAREETWTTDPDPSLRSCLESLSNRFGDAFREIALDEDGALRASLIVTINGEKIGRNDSPRLRDGDQIAFMTPIAGG